MEKTMSGICIAGRTIPELCFEQAFQIAQALSREKNGSRPSICHELHELTQKAKISEIRAIRGKETGGGQKRARSGLRRRQACPEEPKGRGLGTALDSGLSGLGEGMATISVEEQHIKGLLKQAILELLEERQSLFQELIVEAVEDLALLNAIREGEITEAVSRGVIMHILESAA
jgi:hypothetical protein